MNICNLESEGLCNCIPERLLKTFLKHKRTVYELDLQCSRILHVTNLAPLAQQLQILHLNNNQIANLQGIEKLQGLVYLDVSCNAIQDTRPLTALSGLVQLRMAFNQVNRLDYEFKALKELIVLDISYNQLTQLPLELNYQLKSLALQGNQFKNYEEQVCQKYKQLTVLDNQLINKDRSAEYEYIIGVQEQQLIQKFKVQPESLLSRWRQEVFSQLVRNKSLLVLFEHHISQFGQIEWESKAINQKLDQQSQVVQGMQRKMRLLCNAARKQKQQQQHEWAKLSKLFEQTLEERCEPSNVRQFVWDCSKRIITVVEESKKKQFSQELERELLKQENNFMKEQIQSFSDEIKSLRQEYQNSGQSARVIELERQKSAQQLYVQIRQQEEDKLKLQLEIAKLKESNELSLFSIKSDYEQQIQQLKHELEFSKSRLLGQAEEHKLRIQQQQNQYEDRIKIQEMELLKLNDQLRGEYEMKLDQANRREIEKNNDLAKLRDRLSELEMQAKHQADQMVNLQQNQKFREDQHSQAVKQLNQKMKQLEIDNKDEIQRVIIQTKQEVEGSLQQSKQEELNQMQEEFERILRQYGAEIQELKGIKKQLSQQNSDLLKIVELKDGVIRQISNNLIDQSKQQQSKQPNQNLLRRTEELEKLALGALGEDFEDEL